MTSTEIYRIETLGKGRRTLSKDHFTLFERSLLRKRVYTSIKRNMDKKSVSRQIKSSKGERGGSMCVNNEPGVCC